VNLLAGTSSALGGCVSCRESVIANAELSETIVAKVPIGERRRRFHAATILTRKSDMVSSVMR
jgi:hypothetical protein